MPPPRLPTPATPARPAPPPRAPRLNLRPARSEQSVALDDRQIPVRGAEPVAVPQAVSWGEFRRILARLWRPGPPDYPNANLAIVGKARSGKSTLTRSIVDLRERVVLFGTKMVDEPLYGPLLRAGWRLQDKWDPAQTDERARIIFRPPLRSPTGRDIEAQREAFRMALVRAWQTGGWTLWFDEVRYLTEQLGLQRELNLLWLQGGSGGTTLVALTQRPVSVPLNMFEQSRFLVTFKITGVEDRRTMAGYAGAEQPVVFDVAARLAPKEFLFVDTELDIALRSKVELPAGANRS